MDIEREIKVRDAIKYCIENFDSKTATNRIVEFWKDELELQQKQCNIANVSGSLRFSEREVDFAYLCGVFNASGIDGLHKEIQRLKELGKEPHDIMGGNYLVYECFK